VFKDARSGKQPKKALIALRHETLHHKTSGSSSLKEF
jgi:hypothetical protein